MAEQFMLKSLEDKMISNLSEKLLENAELLEAMNNFHHLPKDGKGTYIGVGGKHLIRSLELAKLLREAVEVMEGNV